MSNTTKPLKIIRIKQVKALTVFSKSYIYELAKKGLFPKNLTLVKGGTAVGWLESDITQWIEDCIANQ
ncbi:MAG: AlpA family phage regulatory protein [Thalassotalea sp.]|nr:AlpA family phage regulatory protein [Thalassotalea sp.]